MDGQWEKCRTVLVTGANRGIGLQLVKALVNGKFTPEVIIATARDPGRAGELQELASKNCSIHIVKLDVIDQQAIFQAVQCTSSLVGEKGLNCLINNAGINLRDSLEEVTVDTMMLNYQINTVAPLMIIQAFLPLLRKAAKQTTGFGIGRAAVVNISSCLGSIQHTWEDGAEYRCYPYRASKAALNMVSRCVAYDLEPEGILCCSLHPGWVRTDMGGQEAPLGTTESVEGILSVLGGVDRNSNSLLLDWTGQKLPW
ncbi:C-signal-like [Osmerus eperlanus]|uniref:C-signal-like n=1 Tax=Osmerus eperlanus TaxID=29151 RepID=UPI002E1323CB